MGFGLSNAKVVADRRQTQVAVDIDRRKRDDVQLIPIAWFFIKGKVA